MKTISKADYIITGWEPKGVTEITLSYATIRFNMKQQLAVVETRSSEIASTTYYQLYVTEFKSIVEAVLVLHARAVNINAAYMRFSNFQWHDLQMNWLDILKLKQFFGL